MTLLNFLVLASIASCAVAATCGPTRSLQNGADGLPPVPLWPLPQFVRTLTMQYLVRPEDFRFQLVGKSSRCPIIERALQRYHGLSFLRSCPKEFPGKRRNAAWQELRVLPLGQLFKLEVNASSCESFPHVDMNEYYTLEIDDVVPRARLTAETTWGVLRGLETFSQLVKQINATHFVINSTQIEDYPRFHHRGLLIDSSRHFLPLRVITETLDAMAYNKMNVLHWHIVDDQAFPYVSSRFPSLSEKGSYNPTTHVYSPADVQYVIQEAALRGIRVMPEFDTPGHTQSWGKAFPELLTACYEQGRPTGKRGPMDPSKNSTYTFLDDFLREVTNVFPDLYFHLGGDEVNFSCWMSNPSVTAFMRSLGISGNYAELEQYYVERVAGIVRKYQKEYVVWQEVFDNNNGRLYQDAIIHVWKNPQAAELNKVTASGFRTLLSTCWYLDYISYGSDWVKYYCCDPQDFTGSPEQKMLVIGGEAAIWGEFVDATNLISRTWPRASAVAERLWSAAYVQNVSEATPRFHENRCRMMKRGLRSEPQTGPGYCECDYAL